MHLRTRPNLQINSDIVCRSPLGWTRVQTISSLEPKDKKAGSPVWRPPLCATVPGDESDHGARRRRGPGTPSPPSQPATPSRSQHPPSPPPPPPPLRAAALGWRIDRLRTGVRASSSCRDLDVILEAVVVPDAPLRAPPMSAQSAPSSPAAAQTLIPRLLTIQARAAAARAGGLGRAFLSLSAGYARPVH